MNRIAKSLGIMILLIFSLYSGSASAQTYCNPMNLSYRFCLDEPSRREAADPTIVLYKDKYYLFASKSGGYWCSENLLDWKMVTTKDLPIENYAPAAFVLNDWLYFFTSQSNTIYRTKDPLSGKWEVYNNSFPIVITDPAFLVDDDGRVYFYYGCSNEKPLEAVELDVNNKLNPIGKSVVCFGGKASEHGWEKQGDYNEKGEKPWIEGSWVNKYKGKYYYQYAGPGTEFKSYADGVYVSDKPLGPFTYANVNPFSSRPEGFAAGAGHGSTFADKYGNYWHIATATISVKHMFERRLSLFPVVFNDEGEMYSNNIFGDYPIIMPSKKIKDVSELFPGWMLLSYNKPVNASSSLESFPVKFSCDEDIRTYWSASTGKKGEWLSIDLQSQVTINAIQVNFAENDSKVFGRDGVLAHQYLVEYSSDNVNWKTLVDKTNNQEDLSHPYIVMSTPVKAQYVRITNYRVPGGTFAISGLRVFGKGTSPRPGSINTFTANRLSSDARVINLSWEKKSNAVGYNVRYGTEKNKLYQCFQVYDRNALTLNSLNRNQQYWFQIDAFGEGGPVAGTAKQIVISEK